MNLKLPKTPAFLALGISLLAHGGLGVLLTPSSRGSLAPTGAPGSPAVTLSFHLPAAPIKKMSEVSGSRTRLSANTPASSQDAPLAPAAFHSGSRNTEFSNDAEVRNEFLRLLHEHIQNELAQKTPPLSPGGSGRPPVRRAKIELTVSREGKVESVSIRESSGERELDRWLRTSLRELRPVTRLPGILFAQEAPEFRANLPIEIGPPPSSSEPNP